MAIKYDLKTGLPTHFDGFEDRILGVLPPNKYCLLPAFSIKFPVIPPSEWIETSLKKWNVPVFDQLNHGSCCGQGSVAGFTYAWRQSGQISHEFSPTSVYAHINDNRDQGAVVSDALTCLQTYGTCFMSQFNEDQIYLFQMSKDAQTTAKRFKVLDAYKINNWQEMGTALHSGMPVVSGIAVGENFSDLDANGVAPLPDRIIGGHCLCHIGLKQLGSNWVVETQNSWGERWGNSGFCYLQPDAWDANFGFDFDAFAIVSVLDDPIETDTDNPILT